MTPAEADRQQLLDELAGPERPLSLLESAGVLGGLRWLELEGHSRLGRASVAGGAGSGGGGSGPAGDGADPRLVVWAAASSRAHAWRAEQLSTLLPVSVGLPGANESTRAAGPAVEAFATLLDGLASPLQPSRTNGDESDPAGAWYGLLAAAYERRATFVHASADAPVVRVLRRLASDVRSIAREAAPAQASPGGIA